MSSAEHTPVWLRWKQIVQQEPKLLYSYNISFRNVIDHYQTSRRTLSIRVHPTAQLPRPVNLCPSEIHFDKTLTYTMAPKKRSQQALAFLKTNQQTPRSTPRRGPNSRRTKGGSRCLHIIPVIPKGSPNQNRLKSPLSHSSAKRPTREKKLARGKKLRGGAEDWEKASRQTRAARGQLRAQAADRNEEKS